MRHIRIWVYDGILASGVAGSIDVFTAANAVWADKSGGRRGTAPLFEWRIESLDGKPVQAIERGDLQLQDMTDGQLLAIARGGSREQLDEPSFARICGPVAVK